jgi:hypothetical protein
MSYLNVCTIPACLPGLFFFMEITIKKREQATQAFAGRAVEVDYYMWGATADFR